jgi:hypothetical protein
VREKDRFHRELIPEGGSREREEESVSKLRSSARLEEAEVHGRKEILEGSQIRKPVVER